MASQAPARKATAPIPLDDAIAADVAARYSFEQIRHRLARCEAFAARPGALSSGREAVNDWRKILSVKMGNNGTILDH